MASVTSQRPAAGASFTDDVRSRRPILPALMAIPNPFVRVLCLPVLVYFVFTVLLRALARLFREAFQALRLFRPRRRAIPGRNAPPVACVADAPRSELDR